MLLFPKKPKYLKSFSNRKIIKTNKTGLNKFRFAKIGLISKESGFIPNYQIEAIRLFLRRLLKKKAQIFFRIFPNQAITKKSNEIRLGRGKGALKYWTFYVKQNKILIEISGQNSKLLTLALQAIKYKLTIKSYIYNQNFRWIL